MIEGLRPAAGASVLEIGCGTGRNLVRRPGCIRRRFFGIDVSTEMLTRDLGHFAARLSSQIRVAHATEPGSTAALFGVAAFDQVMISYSLSMIRTGAGA